MAHKISKTSATKIASRLVSNVYPMSGQYCFNYKSGHPSKMWSTSHPTHYAQARAQRKERFELTVESLINGHDDMGNLTPEWFYQF